jgi:hypothetical protein
LTRRGLAALSAVLALAVACDRSGREAERAQGPRLVDSKEVESVLLATQRRSSPDLPVGPASCPAGVPATDAAILECTVSVDGVPAPYAVTVRSTDQPGGLRYDVRPARAILQVSKVVDAIQRSSSSPTSSVECGPARVRVLDVVGTFDCSLSDGQNTRTVRVRVETVEGNVSFKET